MNVNLPPPPRIYDVGAFSQLLNVIKTSLSFAVSKEEAVDSILLQSPNGSVYKLSVDDTGTLVTTAVPLGMR